MTQNTLGDLQNHLFAQMERLQDEDLKGDALDEEINRAQATKEIAKSIIENGELALKASMFSAEYGANKKEVLPKFLGDGNGKN